MGSLDTAKEIVRLSSTAGHSKDVIDLLEKKASLLAEQVASLESENARLKAELAQVGQQLQHASAVRELSAPEKYVLIHLTREDSGRTIDELAHAIGSIPSMARHHCEELEALGLVQQIRFHGMHRRIEGPDWGYALTQEGQKWIAHQPA